MRLQWRDLEIWQCGEKQTIERSATVQVQASWWEGGELLWWDWRGDCRGDNVMTKWESRGVRTNVYWWRSVLYTSSRRGSDYTDLVTLASPHSYQHFTPDLSEQLVPDINIRSSYISLSPREKKIQVAIWRLSAGKKPWETWEKMPSVACKFMLIEAQDMWEHFLLTFNKDKQTPPLSLRVNTLYQCLLLNIIAIQITIFSTEVSPYHPPPTPPLLTNPSWMTERCLVMRVIC